jgi:ISXO2-like transposase domain
VQYQTAFVLTHKLREAMALEAKDRQLNGVVEIDGAYFGGYVKPENRKEDRRDRRLVENRTGKRQCVVIIRERNGKSLPFVVRTEGDAVPCVRDHVGTLATIHADEGTGWDAPTPTLVRLHGARTTAACLMGRKRQWCWTRRWRRVCRASGRVIGSGRLNPVKSRSRHPW